MGRRKERRIAAAGGRRVKLDLFAEPSGDLGGSSAQEQVGGDGDSKTDAELPSSPSSSGIQPQNPLLLLEQYSDDELDLDPNHAVAEDALIDKDEEAKPAAVKEAECAEINHGKDPTIQKAEQLLTDNDFASQHPRQKLEKESNVEKKSDDLQKEINELVEAASDEHLIGDVPSGWKMVLHEESNQYYYWNILTGETSWEVPDVFVQETVTTFAEKVVGDPTGKIDAVMEENTEEDDISNSKLDIDSEVHCQIRDSAGQGMKKDDSGEGFIDNKEVNRDANQTNGTSGTDLPMQLIKQCESLLERLNSGKRSKCDVEGQDLRFKCTLETEIRLGDVKALAYHGSSLLAFWLHSEGRLKQLEAVVDGLVQQNNSTYLVGFEAALESHERVGDDKDTDLSEKETPFAAVESQARHTHEESNYEACNDGAITTEHARSTWYSRTDPDNNLGGQSEITRVEKESESTPDPAPHSDEDVDMDVDMEVEDAFPIKSSDGGPSGAHCHVPTELSNLQSSLADQETAVFNAPPPPVEEWVPPPPPDVEPLPPLPPDDEPFPPPPPDEPPETSYIPSHLGSVQPFPYSDQYSLPYPVSVSSLEYYGHTNLGTSGAAPEYGHLPISHLPQYYEGVPNIYAVAPMIVNPVEPTSYYGLQSATVNLVPLVSERPESSGTLSEHVLATPNIGRAGSVDSRAEDVSNLLSKTNLSLVKPGYGTVKAPPEVPEAQPSIGAPANSSVANNVSVSSMSDTSTSVSAPPAAATSKTQSKVPRGKKRTVAVVSTLRSNKKVSSLVDKWKAAKEELQEEEEEPEDAYEILEKKRQREIEEWRAHQIATGEAKDNANFQPLGGDWRERVKRKRAQKMKETEQSSPNVDGKQQTDLSELSKGLPSGWQVFWDDSSKQAYYGNTLTSETTWSRPTD